MLRLYEYYLSCSLVSCLLPIVAFKWRSSHFVFGRSRFLYVCPQTVHIRWVVSCFFCLFRQVLEYIRSLKNIVHVLSRALFSDYRIIRRYIFLEIKYMIRTAGYTWTDYKTNSHIAKEFEITPVLDKLLEYKRNWIQHVNRMPRDRLPRVMKHYSPTGRRNRDRPLKRLLDTWDRNGSTSGLTPWQTYDDDDNNDDERRWWGKV